MAIIYHIWLSSNCYCPSSPHINFHIVGWHLLDMPISGGLLGNVHDLLIRHFEATRLPNLGHSNFASRSITMQLLTSVLIFSRKTGIHRKLY